MKTDIRELETVTVGDDEILLKPEYPREIALEEPMKDVIVGKV